MKAKIAAALVAGVILYMALRPPRNVRNNNPLNIRHNSGNQWQGAAGDDGEFVIFQSPEYGFRAAFKLLMTYKERYGLNTISEIVNRWAPPSDDNHTDAYIDYLADKLDKYTFTPVWESEYPALMYFMAEFEGAKGAFTMEQAEQGARLA